MAFSRKISRIYKRALSINSRKIAAAGIALTAAILGATVAFAADPGSSSKVDYAMTFNGADTFAHTNSQVIPNNSDFTVEAFFKAEANVNNLGWIVGGGNAGDTANSWGILAGMADATSGACVIISTPEGFNDCLYLRARIPTGDWVHAALTYKTADGTWNAYINGVLMQSGTINNRTVVPGFGVGRSGKSATDVPYGDANCYFKGQIDEVKVFNTVRSTANMLTDTYTYLSPATSGLVAQYDFNEGQFGFGTIYDRTTGNFDLAIAGTAAFSDIAQYTNTSRVTNAVRFTRSYLTAVGGWSAPAGASLVTGNVYGAGGGGGGGAAEAAGNGGGGGGGAPGTKTALAFASQSNLVFPVRVGVGGVPGSYGYTSAEAGGNGTAGQTSAFKTTTAAGGGGGFGGGYASGTATYTAGLGGKGGTSGANFQGSAIASGSDGGASGSNTAAVTNNIRAGAAGITDTNATGTFLKPGDGGYGGASVNAYTGAFGAVASGSGGSGGGGGTTAGWPGGFGSSGTIVVAYSTSTTTQDYDYLYNFNGTQYAETPSYSGALDAAGDFTLEAWVNPANTCAIGFCTIAGRDNNYVLATSNGTYWWRIANSNSASTWYNTGVAFTTGQWQHVALVRSGTSVLLYANGQLMSTQANGSTDASGSTITLTATSMPGPGWFEVAARGVDHTDLFTGGIDEVRVWNTVRTATEIGDGNTGDFNRPLNTAELGSATLLAYWDMNDTQSAKVFLNRKTSATPLSDLGWSELLTAEQNNRSAQITNRFLTVASANSTVAYGVDSPSFELTGSNFTVSGWWQIPSCATTNYLVSKGNTYSIATDSACKINVQLDPGNEGDGQTWQWMNTGYVMSTATWNYVSVIKTGTTLKLYVNGALASTINDGDSVQNFNSAGSVTAVVPANLGDRNTYFGIGSTGVGATRANISSQFIDDIRLWNTDRSSRQSFDMAGFVPHTQTGLQAMFDFNTLQAAALVVPNMASAGASESQLTVASTLTSGVSSSTLPPDGQPVRYQQYMQRSLIKSSTVVGGIPSYATSAEYWISGGGGGGGSGGNSGYTGAGGGAGGLLEGTVTNLTNSTPADAVTTLKVGVGGRYAINNGDSVTAVATNGTPSSFLSTGVSVTAIGGGAGGSGTTTPSTAPQGLDGGSGGGSGQTGGAGGAATQGNAGGAGSSAASGGGGGARTAGGSASSGIGGPGGKGFLLPLANSGYGQYPIWAGGGGSGFGTSSSSNANSAFAATSANTDAAAYSGSGGGGAGFASSSNGTSRGGYGANGYLLINYAVASPYVDSGPTSLQSGQPASTPISISLRDINGDVLTSQIGAGSLSAVSGCTLLGSYTTLFTAGRATISGLNAYSTSATKCVIKFSVTSVTPNSTYVFSLPIRTSPASITINTSATSGVCAFVAGTFSCPDNTAAILNVNDLNAQLNSNDVTLVTRGGDITINSAVSGSTGALNLSAYGAVKMNAGIALTGSNKALTVQSLNQIVGNESASSGSPTAFSTNGGAMYLYTGMGSASTAGYVKLSNYNTFTTNGGAFVVSGGTDPTTGYATGNSAATSTDITANGIYLNTGATISSGAGNITLRGQLYGSRTQYSTPTNAAGITLLGSITSTSGSITLVGYVPNLMYDQNYRNGMTITSATISSDSGDITISGDSTGDAANIYTAGISIAGSSITSNSGNVTATGNTPLNSQGIIKFASPQSTFGSQTGNVTLTAPATLTRFQNFDFMRLTGGGTHSLLFNYPIFATSTTSLQAFGTGDLVISTVGARAFAGSITIPASFDTGTGYKTITLGDNPATASQSQTLAVSAALVASEYVSLKGLAVSGTGSVTSPGLAIVARSVALTATAALTGTSDVDTLAITHGNASYGNGTVVGITDADGWTPGTVAGVTGVYGVAKNVAFTATPSTSAAKNQVLPIQPTVRLSDAYGYPLNSSNLSSTNYTATPSIISGTPTNALAPTTPVTFSNGSATFSGLKFTSNATFGLAVTVSPALAGTSTVSSNVIVSAYAAPTSITVSPASLNATSGSFFATMPTATYWDPYGNPSGSVNGTGAPSVALTSYPAGASASALTSGSFATGTNGGTAAGSNFKLTGPSGTYVLTVTGTYPGTTTSTATITVNLLGWSVSYGASSLNYSTTPYSPTFTGNGTGTVTYSTSTGTICSVNASTGDMTPITAGTCTITASQATDGTYSAGSASVSVTIVAGPQPTVTVSASPADLTYLGSTTLTGGGGAGTGTFTYAKTAGNCTISGAVLSYGTAHAGETCSVTATRSATAGKYTATTSTALVITVVKAAQSTAVVAPTGRTVGYSNTVDLATFTYSGGNGTGAYVFSTSTANCSITGTVLTSFATVGSNCSVSVRRDTSTDYLISNPVTMNVQTTKGSQSVSFVTVASAVRVADSVTLSATASSGLAVTYSLATGSSTYCSIAGAVVTFTAAGTCVVKADQAGDSNVNAASTQTITYTVDKGLQTITFGALGDGLVSLTTRTLAATASSGLAVTYAVGAGTTNSACTVTSSGVVSLNAVGVCEITASQAGSANYEAATDASQSFNIAQGIQAPLVITSPNHAAYGQTITLTATGGSGTGATTWVVNSGPCSIASGTTTLILGDAGTSCVVMVEKAADANWQNSGGELQTVTVDKATQSTLLITNPNTVVYGNQLALTSGGGSGTGAVTWSTVSPCSVFGTNLTVGNAGVSCVVTLSKAGDTNYLDATATLTVSVTRATQSSVTFTSASNVTYGQTLALAATGGNGGGAISFAATGSCSVVGNVLTVGIVGSNCSVTATRAQSTNYLAETSAAVTITVDKADQTIGVVTVTGTPQALGTVALSASSDSGLAVTFSIDSGSTAVCSIAAAIVSFTKAGDCVVNANQSGDSNFNAATQTQETITAAAATQTISLTNPGSKRYLDQSFAISGSASSNLSLFYTLGSNTDGFDLSSAACSVDSNGNVTVLEVGDCEVLANQAGNDVYSAAPQASVTFAIAKAIQPALAITSSTTATYGNTVSLTYTGGAGTGAVTYELGANSTCSVNQQTSVLTLGDVGDVCLARVKQAADAHYEAASSGLESFQVTQASQTINFSSSPNSPAALGTYTVAATATSGDAVVFSIDSNTAAVCSITGNVVSFATSGTCTILADQSGNTNYSAASQVSQTFTVDKVLQNLTYTNPGNQRYGGADFQISASSDSGLPLAFSIGQAAFFGAPGQTPPAPSCSVSTTGVVTILEIGPCLIDVDQPGSDIYHPVATIQILFQVTRANQATLSISSASSVAYSGTITLATTGGSGTGAVTYATTGACTESNGVLTVGNAGSLCTVTATKADDNHYLAASSAAQTVTVTKTDQALVSITSTNLATYGQTLQVVATGGSGPGAWSYSTSGTCSISSTGLLTPGDAASSCSVTATKAESTNYNSTSSLPQTITIAKAGQSIAFTSSASSAVALGTYTVTASADSGDAVTFAIDSGSTTVCSISGSTVSFLTGGTCVINADEDGNANYNAATQARQTVSVALASQSISFTSAGVKRFGDAAFAAQATATSGLTVTYSLGLNTTNSACSVASDGTVTITNVGDCEVVGSQAGNSVYAAATDTPEVITIGKGFQSTLTMASASSVAYGTTLNLATSGGSGTGAVTFAATGDCTISNGVLSVGVVGSNCSVTATKASDSQYLVATSAAQTITVIRGAQASLVISSANNVTYGTTLALSTTGGSGSGTVSYSTNGICTVTGVTLTAGGAGTLCTVTATKAASANYDAISSALVTITIDKSDQTITRGSDPVQPRALQYYTPGATASSSLSVAVTVDASTSSVCSVSNQYIYFNTGGTCLLNYDQAGNSNFNAAPRVQKSITVAKLAQTITGPAFTTYNYGQADFQIIASSSSGLAITYALDAYTTNSSCTVSSTGTAHIAATGLCGWTMSQAGDDVYLPTQTGIYSFSIDRASQAATTLVTSATSAPSGGTITLSVTGGSGTGSISYVTAGTCTVSGSTLTVGDTGSICRVYGIKEFDDNYAARSTAEVTITVTRAAQAALSMSSASSVVFGNTIILATSGGSGPGSVTYATTGTCSVTSGVLTVGDAGSNCSVTATKAQSANYDAVSSAAQTITVTRASQTLSFTSTANLATATGTYSVVAVSNAGLPVTVSVDGASASVCSISGTTVSFLTSGSCVLLADQSGNTNYNAATQVPQNITVATHAQQITATAIARHFFGDASFTVPASSNSGLALTYSLGSGTTNNACSVNSSTGVVTILATGNCSIDLDQAGNNIWAAAARVNTSFAIGKADQAALVISSSATVAYGSVINLTTTGGSVNGAVTYSTTGTCTVATATLFPGDAGSACTVTATLVGNDQYLPVTSATVSITVAKADQAFFILTTTTTPVYGQPYVLTATGGSGDGAVTFEVTSPCTISGNVVTLGDATSTCLVTARKGASQNYKAISDLQRVINVVKAPQTINLTATPLNATALGTYTVVATATSGLTPTVSVAPATAANCSVSGFVVTFNNALTCDLQVTQAGNSNFNPATMVPQSIHPQLAIDTVTIPSMANRTIFSTDLTVAATSVSGVTLTYASIAPSNGIFNCSITSSGTLTLIQPGICWIRANHAAGSVYDAATTLNSFMITRAEQTALTMTSASSAPFLDTIALTASGGSGTGAISFTANGSCAITNDVLSLGEVGSACSVTATRAGDTNYNATTSATQNITVTQIAQEPIVVMSAASVRFGQSLPLVSVGGSGSGSESWTVDTGVRANSANCAINSGALTLSAATSGSCDIVVSKAASRNYVAEVSPRFTVTVTKAIQSITFTSTIPSEPLAGDTYTVTATANSGLAPAFAIANASSAYCSISGAVVTFIATGDCVIEADQIGDGRYLAAATKLLTIAVGAKNQIIQASAVVDRRFGDTAFVITATASSSSPVTFAVGPNTTASACAVNNSGVVQVLAVGHCEIVLSAVADSQYAAASDITRVFEVVADQASAPFITSMSANNQEVTVSFLPPTYTGGVALGGYGINAYVNGTLAVTTSSCDVNASTCTIEGLTNGTDYTISMFAINVAGDGALSIANGPIRPATHAAAVQRLVAVGVNTALDISWAAPASLGGGTFDSYRIYVRPRGGSYPATPTDQVFTAGQTSTQITGLTNGQSYDVKVVTITSANTLQLVSNTAEVVQYPRTIPDAPQAVTLSPINSSGLLISWMDPASDGGDAIQSYEATVVGGQSCTVTPGTNLCEVTGLVSGTTYRVEVVAVNSAGTSSPSEASITFRSASVNTPPVINGGGSSSGYDSGDNDPGQIRIAFDRKATASLNASKNGFWISRVTGGKAVFTGRNLNSVRKALVSDKLAARIISQTDTQLVLQVPPGTKDGVVDIWFYATSHTLRYMEAIVYVSDLKPIVKSVTGFAKTPNALTKAQVASIKKFLPSVQAYKHVTCVGTTKDAWLTCKQIKTLRPSIFVRVVKQKPNAHTKAGQQAYKTVKLTFTK